MPNAEKLIDCGCAEELILQAENELSLVAKVLSLAKTFFTT